MPGFLLLPRIYYDVSGGGGGAPLPDNNPPDPVADFDGWLAAQPETTRAAYEAHTRALKSALVTERENGKTLKAVQAKLKTYEDADEQKKRDEQTKEQQLEADLSAANAKATKAEGDLDTERRNRAIERAAYVLGFADVQDAVHLVDASKLTKSATTGEWEGADTALKALVEAKPYLVKKTGAGLGNNTNQKDTTETKKPPAEVATPRIVL